jgi:hypothetical protein
MALRKLAVVAPVIGALALAAPVAGASAQTAPAPGTIPCYPYPAFCGPGGQPWWQFFSSQFSFPGIPSSPGTIQLPSPSAFGLGAVQIPGLQIPGLQGP